MTQDGVQVTAERREGTCLLRISGELDLITVDGLGERADAAVQALPGPVVVDLSGLTFIDANAARALDAVIRTLPEGRLALVRCCPRGAQRVFELLGLSLDYRQADYSADLSGVTRGLANRVSVVQREARSAHLKASATRARLTDTKIRLASTIERSGLIREQAQQVLAASREARERLALLWAATPPAPRS